MTYVIRVFDRDTGVQGICGFQWSSEHDAYVTKTWYHTEAEALDAACEMQEDAERYNWNRVYLAEKAPEDLDNHDFICL